MDLMDLLKTMWRYKWLMILSILIGVALAVSVYEKSFTTYESSTELLVDSKGFGLGRVDSNLGQTGALANTYVSLIMSDKVKNSVNKKVGPITEDIKAQAANNAPVIIISVSGLYRQKTRLVAQETANSFIDYFKKLQIKNKIPGKSMVAITIISKASQPMPIQSRTVEIAIIIFFAPFMAMIGFVLILKNLSDSNVKLRVAKEKEDIFFDANNPPASKKRRPVSHGK